MAKETIQSVERTFQVIELLAEKGAMGVREIGHETGLHSTVVHRVLGTLVDLGYAGQEEETGKYLLTYKNAGSGQQHPGTQQRGEAGPSIPGGLVRGV